MADKKISALPAATTPLAGTEVLPVVQGGTTDQVSVANLTAGRAVTMSGLGVGVAAPASGINATANTGLPSGTVAGTNFWLVGADGTANTLLFDAFNTVSVIGRRSNGTLAAPSAISSNTLFTIGARGYGATGYSSANRAQIAMVATEAWTDAAQGAQLTFATTANGGTTLSTRMTIDNAGNVGIGAAPISAFSVAGTTGFTWSSGGTSSGLVTIGTQGTAGGSLFVNTASASTSFASGLAVDGTYPGGVGVSVINLKAVGVQSGGGYGSDLAFHTSSGATLTEQMRISSAGNITASTGNLVVGTAGKGIDFSASTHAPGMTSELLDDYEEGTWVPSVGGNATYTIQEGYYVRVGDLVYVQCQLLLNVLGTGSTTTISGLPFTAFSPSNSSRGTGSVWYCGNLATGVTMLTPGITPAGQDITFGGFPVLGAGTTMSVPLTVFQNGTRVDFSLVYRAN